MTSEPLPAQFFNQTDLSFSRAPGHALRSRTAVPQALTAYHLEARHPLVDCARPHPCRFCGWVDSPDKSETPMPGKFWLAISDTESREYEILGSADDDTDFTDYCACINKFRANAGRQQVRAQVVETASMSEFSLRMELARLGLTESIGLFSRCMQACTKRHRRVWW